MHKPSLLKELPVIADKAGWPWNTEVDGNIYSSDTHWPKISIVTPSYNQGHYIEETIRSILLQNYPNLEYIIIDGGSTDNTVEIIKKYAPWITYWVSEKDKGQADAINKGVERCTGEIFNWINSDDYLMLDCLHTIATLYKPGATVAGQVFNLHEEDLSLNDYTQNEKLNVESFLNFEGKFHQPGIWCDLKQFKKAGPLSLNDSYYFDRIFLTGYFLQNTNIIYTDEVLVGFRVHMTSKTFTIQKQKHIELVNAYKHMLQSPKYRSHHRIIRRSLNVHLLPYNSVAQWDLKNDNKTKAKRIATYLMLPFRNPKLVASRYYFIVLKKKMLTGKW